VPSAGSITRILHRHGLISAQASAQHRPLTRFTAPVPNDLWQMDFKGHFALVGAGRCHPLTVLDDHSRFNLGLRALPHEQAATVQAELITLFQRYGLPNRILCDNSPPWGTAYRGRWTKLGVWLLLLDVGVIHGRPWHPQTQGKDERFHRTLNTELLRTRSFASLTEVQTAFDQWRIVYNQIRPHEALGLDPPIDHYQPSLRSYPERLPAVEYASGEVVRTVNSRGTIAIKGAHYYVGEGFTGYPVAIRPTADAALWDVYFRHYVIAQIDRRESAEQ
jgi:transposase InsO family protein